MNQGDHWQYTVQEWQRDDFFKLLIEAFSQNPQVIWDVGACVGGWSEVVNSHFPGKEIYAFEPFEDNFNVLKERSQPNVICLPYGLYYGKTEAKAMWRGENVGSVFIDEVDITTAFPTNKTLQLKTLEEVEYPKPDLIKFDVEGAELNIIENSTLLQSVPQLLVEWHYREGKDAVEFFAKHLPHKVVEAIGNDMFLLRL